MQDGAALFLSGIDKETRKNVYFYTTTYQQGKVFGDYCNLAVNAILEWPNDGITELRLGKLDGANYMGNKEVCFNLWSQWVCILNHL